jgi:DNA-binding LacI/PurR family transcriptional regulator
VSQDISGMVSTATELLLTRIAAQEPLAPRRVVLTPTMIHRGTHGPPPLSA